MRRMSPVVEKLGTAAADTSVQTGAGLAFQVILADPPWAFKVRSAKGAKKSPKYDTMSRADILEFGKRVKAVAAKDCVLFMWVTSPFLADGLVTLAEWGFEYKSSLVWCKPRKGTGYWARNNHEIVLIATRGKPRCPPPTKRRDSVILGAPVEKRHSSKPAAVHEYVESWWPEARKLEIFARTTRPGWKAFGNEIESSAHV